VGKNKGYKKYMKDDRDTNDDNKVLKIFLTTFFCMLVFFALVAKQLSPEIDVTIGENNTIERDDDEFINSRTSIDQRLKDIQEDDRKIEIVNQELASQAEQTRTAQSIWDKKQEEVVLDEKVSLPKFKTNALTPDNPFKPSSASNPETPVKQLQPIQANNNYVYKVYIGYYTSLEQARVAQGILLDTNLGLNPFVKDIGNGNFSLQVGSFNNREKAQALVSQLLSNHFPARIIQE